MEVNQHFGRKGIVSCPCTKKCLHIGTTSIYIDIQTVYNKKFNNNNEHEYEESMYSNKNYQAINYQVFYLVFYILVITLAILWHLLDQAINFN